MLRESLLPLVRRTLAYTVSLICGACAEGQSAEYAAVALPDGSVPADASAIMEAAMAPLPAACAELQGEEPRSISDVVARINQLPEPASIPCLVASLPRPLSLVASRSRSSAQPASGTNSPRIFILLDALTLSVVPTGIGKDLLEFGEWVETKPGAIPQSTKGELVFPVSRPLGDDAPYLHIAGMGRAVSDCGFCHPSETQHPTIPSAFVSDAMRAGRDYELPIDAVRTARTRCDSEDGPQCELLRALFDHGEVRQGAFDTGVRTGF